MPYIKEEDRKRLDALIYDLSLETKTDGQLNYVITRIVQDYIDGRPSCYSDIVTILGSLEAVKQEFYRRAAIPFEENKIIENGDVY